MKRTLSFIVPLFFLIGTYGQSAISLGFSPAYVPSQSSRWQHEFNLNTYASFPLWSNLELEVRFMGIAYTSVRTRRQLEPAFMVGPSIGWRQPVDEQVAFSLKGGIMTGNYCTCGADDPYPRPGTQYWHLLPAFHFSPKTWENWWVDLGFWIQNGLRVPNLQFYGHHMYVLGLNYRIASDPLIRSRS